MLPILLYMDRHDQSAWVKAFKSACPEADVRVYPDWGDDKNEPCYAFLWKPKRGMVADHPNIKIVFYGGAGIDHLLADPTLPADIPIVRLSDDGLKSGMADWVAMSVMLHNRQMPQVLANQRRKHWDQIVPILPQSQTVGFMGYGALGKVCAERLKIFGFNINTWSNSLKAKEFGVKHHYGPECLKEFLSKTDILVSLLPATTDTDDLLNADTLACLPRGASVINAGRGNVLDTTALLDAIERGHIAGASLDVFKTEPLPTDDPLWACERVILTPHISATTRHETAANHVIKSMRDYEATGKLMNLYVRERGY